MLAATNSENTQFAKFAKYNSTPKFVDLQYGMKVVGCIQLDSVYLMETTECLLQVTRWARASTVYRSTDNITMCLLKNGYRFLPLLPKIIVNVLWACIQYNKKQFLVSNGVFLSLCAAWVSHFHILLAYKNGTPDVTLWKLNTANVRRTQITKIKESTV